MADRQWQSPRRGRRCHLGGAVTRGPGMGRALAAVHGSMAGAGLRGLMAREEASGLVMEAAEVKAVVVEEVVAAEEGVESRLVSALAGIKAIMAALEAAAAVLVATVVAVGVALAVAVAVAVALEAATVVDSASAAVVATGVASAVETLVGSVVVSMEKLATAVEDMVAVTALLVDTAAPVLAPEMVMSFTVYLAVVATEVGLGIRARGSSAVEAGASVVISSAAGGRHQHTRMVAATTEAARRLQLTTSNDSKHVVYRTQKSTCTVAMCDVI